MKSLSLIFGILFITGACNRAQLHDESGVRSLESKACETYEIKSEERTWAFLCDGLGNRHYRFVFTDLKKTKNKLIIESMPDPNRSEEIALALSDFYKNGRPDLDALLDDKIASLLVLGEKDSIIEAHHIFIEALLQSYDQNSID